MKIIFENQTYFEKFLVEFKEYERQRGIEVVDIDWIAPISCNYNYKKAAWKPSELGAICPGKIELYRVSYSPLWKSNTVKVWEKADLLKEYNKFQKVKVVYIDTW